MNTVLIVDEVDRLPQKRALSSTCYAMRRPTCAWCSRHAPINLGIDDLIDYGQCRVVAPAR
jgi:hypothetical protein